MSDIVWASVSALILGAIGIGVRYVNAFINAHFKPAQMGAVFDLARSAVSAAQEFGVGRGLAGQDKYNFAAEALVAGAKKLGVKLSDEEASSFIHAALREMKQLTAF